VQIVECTTSWWRLTAALWPASTGGRGRRGRRPAAGRAALGDARPRPAPLHRRRGVTSTSSTANRATAARRDAEAHDRVQRPRIGSPHPAGRAPQRRSLAAEPKWSGHKISMLPSDPRGRLLVEPLAHEELELRPRAPSARRTSGRPATPSQRLLVVLRAAAHARNFGSRPSVRARECPAPRRSSRSSPTGTSNPCLPSAFATSRSVPVNSTFGRHLPLCSFDLARGRRTAERLAQLLHSREELVTRRERRRRHEAGAALSHVLSSRSARSPSAIGGDGRLRVGATRASSPTVQALRRSPAARRGSSRPSIALRISAWTSATRPVIWSRPEASASGPCPRMGRASGESASRAGAARDAPPMKAATTVVGALS